MDGSDDKDEFPLTFLLPFLERDFFFLQLSLPPEWIGALFARSILFTFGGDLRVRLVVLVLSEVSVDETRTKWLGNPSFVHDGFFANVESNLAELDFFGG